MDATHSFRPDGTALDALEELFNLPDKRPLLVGINLGMLANFANHSPDTHKSLKAEVRGFFAKAPPGPQTRFVDFNNFPKFAIDDTAQLQSSFLVELLGRITRQTSDNPIYLALKGEEAQRTQRWKNFVILGQAPVRRRIVHVLGLCQLRDGVFLPTRSILDTVHHLIRRDAYLFDTLFTSTDTDLLRSLATLDPAARRAEDTDRFLLTSRSEEALAFQLSLRGLLGFDLDDVSAAGWLRLYYLLQGDSLGNNYHRHFAATLNDLSFHNYLETWQAHEAKQRNKVRAFCEETLRPALLAFANRASPRVGPNRLYLGRRGSLQLAAPIHLKAAPTDSLPQATSRNADRFTAVIKPTLNSSPMPIDIGYRLFDLLERVRDGLRPNPHDKSTVMLLESLVQLLLGEAAKQDELILSPDATVGGHSGWKLRLEGSEIDVEAVE